MIAGVRLDQNDGPNLLQRPICHCRSCGYRRIHSWATLIERRWGQAYRDIRALADQVEAYHQLESLYKDELTMLTGKASKTVMLDLKPGDEFEIKLGRKQIKLSPLGSTEEE